MNDNELINELSDLLVHESSAVRAPPDLAARSRALHRRRRARLAVAGAVPAVATAAVLAAGGNPPLPTARHTAPVTPARPARQAVLTQRTAYVTRRVNAALADDANQYIKERTQTSPPRNHVLMHTWIDPVTGSVWTIQYQQPRIGEGNKQYYVRNDYQHSLYRSIDYTNHTWTEQEEVVGPIGKPTPPSYAAHPSFDSTAAAIRKALDRGHVTLIGTGAINGYRALKIDLGTSAYGPPTLWVYADTYHPLLIRFDRHFSETWLPRTAATIARADPTIPTGFRHVQPSAFH